MTALRASPVPGPARRAIGIAGVVFLDAGFALILMNFKGATVPQVNGVCSQGMGQVFGLTARDCALAGHLDHLIGWLIGQGLVILAGYAILRLARRAPPVERRSGFSWFSAVPAFVVPMVSPGAVSVRRRHRADDHGGRLLACGNCGRAAVPAWGWCRLVVVVAGGLLGTAAGARLQHQFPLPVPGGRARAWRDE